MTLEAPLKVAVKPFANKALTQLAHENVFVTGTYFQLSRFGIVRAVRGSSAAWRTVNTPLWLPPLPPDYWAGRRMLVCTSSVRIRPIMALTVLGASHRPCMVEYALPYWSTGGGMCMLLESAGVNSAIDDKRLGVQWTEVGTRLFGRSASTSANDIAGLYLNISRISGHTVGS
ncbi:hypothetical protein BDV96DRAFT_597527 [Lophiotrema nucula]|uniref:Uncharacterized protein n=1 Tax=Lophiotrema nucula TaxID=690887 RepID=A0A6A5ZGU9_9PLEO|nr:hypothetical protein BDV96DRAFT_597527 [Lophiotrema nucula]